MCGGGDPGIRGEGHPIVWGRGIPRDVSVREEAIQVYGGRVGGGSRGVDNFVFNSAKAFKATLHFMYAICTDQHIWHDGCDFAFLITYV